MTPDEDEITVEEIDFEIAEAKKRYEEFPYYLKEHFKSVRRSIFGDENH